MDSDRMNVSLIICLLCRRVGHRGKGVTKGDGRAPFMRSFVIGVEGVNRPTGLLGSRESTKGVSNSRHGYQTLVMKW